MYIHEAIASTSRENPTITRKAWSYSFLTKVAKVKYGTICIQPTNSPDRCVVLSPMSGYAGQWFPTKDDLLADDWEVATYSG